MFGKSTRSPASSETLPGREVKMPVPAAHYVNGHPLQAPFPAGMQQALFGMGCFWGAERKFWELKAFIRQQLDMLPARHRTPATAKCAAA